MHDVLYLTTFLVLSMTFGWRVLDLPFENVQLKDFIFVKLLQRWNINVIKQ